MSRVSAGTPDTLGVTVAADGIDVAVHAPDADAVALCLFDATDHETARIRLPARTGGVHHAHVAQVPPGTRYGLRAFGPWDPKRGLRFNPAKLLLDPWATAIDRPFRLDPLLFDHDEPRPEDTAPLMPKALVGLPPSPPAPSPPAPSPPAPSPPAPSSPTPSYSDPHRPDFDWDRQVIYELHVRGFTMTHPDIPAAIRGTFAALGHPASIAHLHRIGVTTVEIMPSAAWIDERHLPPLNLTNYWGYNPVAFLAPDPRLAPGGWAEVRGAVDALHAAGLHVILDVVLNHSGESDERGPTLSLRGLDNAGYYRLAADRSLYVDDAGCGNVLAMDRPIPLRLGMDALRAWALYGGIDGFRLDLAVTLARRENGFDPQAPFLAAVEQDPVLSRRVMIAEPWDIGSGGYRLGAFPARWGEWNDRYRDSVRRFWRGDHGTLGDFTTRFAGSADTFGRRPLSRSINFITAHDGFTLTDLVSYSAKHNQANGENNKDGTDDNLSWNNGAEGPSSDPAINARRSSDLRALLATLLLSRGTPMLSMGDELGRTQAGNNNAYAQDSAASWIDWSRADQALTDFTAATIALRATLAPLFNGQILSGQPTGGTPLPDVAWLGAGGQPPDWNNGATLVAVLFAAGQRAALVFHADRAGAGVALPPPRTGFQWWRVLDTAGTTDGLTIAARSVTVFQEARSQPQQIISAPLAALTEPPTQRSRAQQSSTQQSTTPQSSTGQPPIQQPLAPQSSIQQSPAQQPPSPPPLAEQPSGTAPSGVSDIDLDHLAERAGIDAVWWDVDGGFHKVGIDTKRALLAAMRLPASSTADMAESLARINHEPPLPPALTILSGDPIPVRLGQPRPAWVTLLRQDGGLERFPVPQAGLVLPPQPIGRHRLLNEDDPNQFCHLTVAPAACYLPPDLAAGDRRFGIAAHLYSLRSQGDQGIGDFTTLAQFARVAARSGAAIVGLNPLHALFPHDRSRTSPYHPSDRRFLDPIYIDVSKFPGGAGMPRVHGPVDYPTVWARKREILLANVQPPAAIPEPLRRFATFQAIAEILGTSDWRAWPPGLRHPHGAAVAAFGEQHRETVAFHAFMQNLAESQLAAAAASAAQDHLTLGFYRDLAVGAAPDGAEAWSAQDTLMHGVSVGAPPDPFSAAGQVWSLPPPDPVAMRRDGFAAFNDLLVANMRHAGALRIDHVMGLRRLFVVPDGAGASEGAYISYPLRDLLGQVTLQSQHAQCLVVGEDLGTVPEGMSDTLAASNILSYSVLWFERRDGKLRPPSEWRRLAAACVSTHDLPTLAGWWNGADIIEKRALGLLDDPHAETARTAEKQTLIDLLENEALLDEDIDLAEPMPESVAAAIHAFVSATPALLALVQADDLAGETVAVNLPGTDKERPNWRRRLDTDVADLCNSPLARAILSALRARAM